jgi:hypothetical protein
VRKSGSPKEELPVVDPRALPKAALAALEELLLVELTLMAHLLRGFRR